MQTITPAEYKALVKKKTSRNLFSVINSAVQGWEMEYRFDEKRKFRFDFALPNLKIAVEYEGIFSEKSRHTSVLGYSKDVEKYNLATIQGWSVLRYTAKNYKDAANDVFNLIELKTNELTK